MQIVATQFSVVVYVMCNVTLQFNSNECREL